MSVSAAGLLADKAEAATPKKGGRIRLGMSEGATSSSLDPATTADLSSIQLNHTIRNYLTEIAPDNSLIPELAASWESNADASEWYFKLRKGIEFHNGKTVDSTDVVDSINYHRHEESKSAARALLTAMKEISADGKEAFNVKLESGNADFPFLFTDYHLNILPSNGDGTIDWQSGVGTGAFVLENFEPGVRTTATRNPNYWKEGRGHFDEFEALILSDNTARGSALITGEVDAIDQAELRTAGQMASQDHLEVDNVTSWAHTTIPMHMDVEPFDKHDVRLALKYAIDREQLVKLILRGYGAVGNDHPISPAIQYYAELEQRTYDREKAKFHLKKAGLTSLKIDLSTSEAAGAGSNDAAILYKEQAASAGIEINVVQEAVDGYWSNVWLKVPFCVVNWGGRPTADVMFTTAYAAEAPWNESHFKHERFNQLLVAARAELNSSKRADMYREMQIILKDEGGSVVPMFKNLVYIRNSRVQHGPELSANWGLDGYRASERWWFA